MLTIPGCECRPVTVDDVTLLVPLYEAYDVAAIGEVDLNLADIDRMVRDPRNRLDESVVVLEAGAPVGVLVPTLRGGEDQEETVVDLELVVHPERPQLTDVLVEHGLAVARRLGGPTDGPVRLDVWTLAGGEKDSLARHGFDVAARHVRMHRDLTGDETEPAAAEGIRVRLAAGEEDRRTFHAVLVAVFADAHDTTVDPYDVWSARMDSSRTHDPSQWWLLEEVRPDGTWRAVGLVQGNRQGEADGSAWVNNYGLVPEARGRGLGGYLLRWAIARFAGLGYRAIGLGMDLDNTTSALEVYTRAGFRQRYSADRFSRRLDRTAG